MPPNLTGGFGHHQPKPTKQEIKMKMTFNTITTLNEIRAEHPCREGWEKLLAQLGKTKADYEPLELLTIINSNGLDDAMWCLQVPSLERLSRHFQAWCAEQVLHHFESEHPDDMRVRNQIAMLRNDTATNQEREFAKDAARAAARDAADAAARAAADAARAAADAAARDAAWAAARAAAWAAADAAQEKQLRKMIGGAE